MTETRPLADERASGAIRPPSDPRPSLLWLDAVLSAMPETVGSSEDWLHVLAAYNRLLDAGATRYPAAVTALNVAAAKAKTSTDARRPIPRYASWSVAEVAEHQARLWAGRGYPAGGQGGGASAETWCFRHERASARCTPGDPTCDLQALHATGDRMGDLVARRDDAATVWPRMKRTARHARAALAELARHDTTHNLRAAHGHLVALARLVDEAAGLVGGPAPDDLNDRPVEDRGCAHCWSMGGWEKVHATTDVGGNLDEPVALCQRCLRWCRDTGRLPTLEEWQAQERGDGMKVRKLRSKAVAAWEAAQKARPAPPPSKRRRRPREVIPGVNADATTTAGTYAAALTEALRAMTDGR